MEVQIYAEDRCGAVKGHKLCRLLSFQFSASKTPLPTLQCYTETSTWQTNFFFPAGSLLVSSSCGLEED